MKQNIQIAPRVGKSALISSIEKRLEKIVLQKNTEERRET